MKNYENATFLAKIRDLCRIKKSTVDKVYC